MGWHGHQIGFFESYVLPLVSSLADINVLGEDVVTEMKFHVLENHIRWKIEGTKFADKMAHPWSQLPVGFFSFTDPHQEEVFHDSISLRDLISEIRLKKKKTRFSMPATIVIPNSRRRLSLTESQRYDSFRKSENGSFLDNDSTFHVDRASIGGLRYVLACYVMFMHIGSKESWGPFSNLRGIPWHEHIFFLLGGYSLALPMNPIIVAKSKYVASRIRTMYPTYLIAVILGLVNLLITCRPSTFSKNFHWGAQPEDLLTGDGDMAPLFCEGTPVIPSSYWGNIFTTTVVSLFGLTVTPLWPLSWFLGYFSWFNSIYYQCLAIFPLTYNAFFNAREKKGLLLKIMLGLILLNYTSLLLPWFFARSYGGDTHHNYIIELNDTVALSSRETYNDDPLAGIWILHFFLFGPFWMIYFVMGICLAFLYDAINPVESYNKRICCFIADGCTLVVIMTSIAVIYQGTLNESIPDDTDNHEQNNMVIIRLWDTILPRLACPFTALWVFALSTGRGFTAKALRCDFLVKYLAPNAYNCFLFHQMITQWYFAATRNGYWWNYWRYRETFYWFSPQPCPIEWYEYPLLVILTTSFSQLITNFLYSDTFIRLQKFVVRKKKKDEDKTLDMC